MASAKYTSPPQAVVLLSLADLFASDVMRDLLRVEPIERNARIESDARGCDNNLGVLPRSRPRLTNRSGARKTVRAGDTAFEKSDIVMPA